jgi:hypothetical protein
MRPAPDDEFKLRFPVAKDRTLRRIGIIQLILVILIPVSFLLLGIAGNLSRRHDPRWPDIYGDVDINSPFYIAGFIPAVVLFLSILALIFTSIIKSIVFTRRYGWRAVSDPIEAQRIAMREALYMLLWAAHRPCPTTMAIGSSSYQPGACVRSALVSSLPPSATRHRFHAGTDSPTRTRAGR